MSDILIRGGCVLTMEPQIGELPVGDVHVRGDRIMAVAKRLEVPNAEIIDAAGCIVTPGFIDGHSHCWQSLLRGIASDLSFPQYMNERAMFSGCYDEDAAYIANLLGGLQAIDAGITTIVDHSHLQKTPGVSDSLARGLLDSGVGGFFCYALQNVPDFQNETEVDAKAINDLLTRPADEWHYANAERVKKTFFDSSTGPLRFGVALYEGTAYVSAQDAKELFKRANRLQPALLTSHWNAIQKPDFYKSNLGSLYEADAFTSPTILSHNNQLNDEDFALMAKAKIGHCTCPDTESGMGLGPLVARRFALLGGASSLGVDTTCVVGADMLRQAHLMLLIERMILATKAREYPRSIGWPLRSVFELLTNEGARAVGLEHEVGSLTPGKRADVLVVKPNALLAQPMADAFATLIFYTVNSDIRTVLVNGQVRKHDGGLQGVDMETVQSRAKAARARIQQRYAQLRRDQFQSAWAGFF